MPFVQLGHYSSISAMAKDVELLVKNAKTYNEPGSQVFKVSAILRQSCVLTGEK